MSAQKVDLYVGSDCLTSDLRPLLLPFLALPHASWATFFSTSLLFLTFSLHLPPSSADFPVNPFCWRDASPVTLLHCGFLLKLEAAGALQSACWRWPATVHSQPHSRAGLRAVFSKITLFSLTKETL